MKACYFVITIILLLRSGPCFGYYKGSKFMNRLHPKASTSSVSTDNCPQTSFEFPNTKQTTDYIRVKTRIPDLPKFTVCGWYNRYEAVDQDSLISYSSAGGTNAFTFIVINANRADVQLNNHIIQENLSLKTNREYHICIVTHAESSAKSFLYVDGELMDVYNGNNAWAVKGGGVFILGQEQDGRGGGFHPNQSVRGTISNFMLWTRALSEEDIVKMYQNRCTCPTDYLFTLEDDNIELFGGVSAIQPRTCN